MDAKVIIFHKRRRKNSKKTKGHRQVWLRLKSVSFRVSWRASVRLLNWSDIERCMPLHSVLTRDTMHCLLSLQCYNSARLHCQSAEAGCKAAKEPMVLHACSGRRSDQCSALPLRRNLRLCASWTSRDWSLESQRSTWKLPQPDVQRTASAAWPALNSASSIWVQTLYQTRPGMSTMHMHVI